MSDSEKDEKMSQFQSITGVEDVGRATFFLESSNWQVDLAIAAFYENDEETPGVAAAAAAAAAPSDDSMDTDTTQYLNKKKTKKSTKTSSNIHNFANLDNDSDSDDSDSGQAFFAGGSETSGQQILGPPKKKGSEFVSEMFKRAREQGAEAVEGDDYQKKGGSGGAMRFGGTGYTLGSMEGDSQVIAGPSGAPRRSEPREFTLKMWSNGFSLDDGPRRPYDDPANREFLASIMQGKIPIELVKEARGGEVHVNMEDHKTEEYVQPKVKAKPFSGAGHVLGSVVPQVTETVHKSEDEKKKAEAQAGQQVKIDQSQPTTNLQIRLGDGSRLVVKLNQTHTVGDLRQYIVISRPEYSDREFALLTTFPNKELTEDGVTLKDAGLLGAAILLRLK